MFTSAEEVKHRSVFISDNVETANVERILNAVHENEIVPLLGSYYDTLHTAFTSDTLSPQQKELVRLLKLAYICCVERDAAVQFTYRITNAGLGIFQPEGFQVKEGGNMLEYFARNADSALDRCREKLKEILGTPQSSCGSEESVLLPFLMR
ncbi:MAG: hypothetical protein KatS3mg038_2154 [Candidatus Kapaibacterium sp.]|nr:MAG: hypothetical protein KatS3mg038_2154 [Candidatus Kapabacteria bacterium]